MYTCTRCRGASCPLTKNDTTAVKKHHRFGKSVEHCFWKGMKPFPALARPDIVNVLLRTNAALDNQTLHAEPQSLLSRRDNTCERLRSQRGLWPYEERSERPSVYVERLRRYAARIVMVHHCELLPRPKVSLHALILRGNNSMDRLSLRLRGKIYTPPRESTCIIARVSWGWSPAYSCKTVLLS